MTTWRPWAFSHTPSVFVSSRPPPIRPADPPEDPPARICWGRASDFQMLATPDPPGLTVEWPERDECDPNSLFYDQAKCEEKEAPCDEYTEDWREYEVVRVTNPDDDEQYVDVERITKMQFTGPAAKSADGEEGGENRKVCFVFTQHPNEGAAQKSGRRGG